MMKMITRRIVKFITDSRRFAASSSTSIKEKEINVKSEKFPGWNEALPFESIPGDFCLPFVGSIWQFLPLIGELHGKDLVDIFQHLNTKYGKICAFKVLDTRQVVLFDPNDMELLFRNEGPWPVRRPLKAMDHYRRVVKKDFFQGVVGVASSNGQEWYDFRSLINPIFMQTKAIRMYIDNMTSVTTDLVNLMLQYAKEDANNEMPEDFSNDINRWSLDSVSVIAFDNRIGCLDANLKPDSDAQRLITNVTEMFKLENKLDFRPSFWKLTEIPTPSFRRLMKVMDDITEIAYKYVSEALHKIQNPDYLKSDHQMSILEKLVQKDLKSAVAMAMDLIVAGIDTTSRTTATILYFLARNPDKQEDLRRQLIKVMPTPDAPVTEEVLSKTPLLRAVIKESLRLVPISPGNSRATVKDMVLQGYQIPKGTEIFTNHLTVSLDEKYVHRAKEFLPERWLRSTEGPLAHKNMNPFVSLPFGFGPRSCVGIRVAYLEMETAIAKIVRNLELSWHHEDMRFTMESFYGIADPLKIRVRSVDK